MKYKHSKWFYAFYALAMLMMGTPLIGIANKPVMVFGMPAIATWIIVWTLAVTLLMCLQYRMDCKVEDEAKKND